MYAEECFVCKAWKLKQIPFRFWETSLEIAITNHAVILCRLQRDVDASSYKCLIFPDLNGEK